jgi:selenocysteine lyase/cysteine desulfurase
MNKTEAFNELEKSVHAALETYSNVHRGSGHFSMVTTHLYEKARDIVLDYLELEKGKYVSIFCSPGYADVITEKLKPESYKIISGNDFGLSLGIRALAIHKKHLPKGVPFYRGGGTTRLISPDWVIWAKGADKFEAGTPAIINVIAFARALQLIKKHGKEIFLNPDSDKLTASEILYHDDLEKLAGHELLDELRKTVISRDIPVPTAEGIRPYINLDNSASTPAFTPVWKAVCQTWRQPLTVKQEIVQEVKAICAGALGAPLTDYDFIFTYNTTEAINMAAESISREYVTDNKPVVVSTLLEHSSNDLPWRFANTSVIRLSIDNEGFVDHNVLEGLLVEYNQDKHYGEKRIRLVAISGASNVLGSFNNLEEISSIAHKYGAQLLVDAAQLVAHRKIEMEKWGIDFLAFSAHKIYSPFGTGVLVVRKGLLNLKPEELVKIKSSGEENAGGIAALGKAFVLMQRVGMELISEEERTLTIRALTGMAKIEGLTVFGVKDPESRRFDRKVGVIVFFLKGFMSDKVAKELSLRRGIGIRYGCHCAHMLVKHILGVSPGLEKFQKIIARLFPRLRFPGVARISFGLQTTSREVDTLIEVLGKIAGKTKIISQKETEKQIAEFVKTASIKVYAT